MLTTPIAADRLGGPARGLAPWTSVEVSGVTVTAVPAQHGPDGTEALTGPVTGFVLSGSTLPTTYISGDNASLAHVERVAERFPDIAVAVLFAGAARTPLVDGCLTLTSAETAQAAQILGCPRVLVVHTDGWAHFTEGARDVASAFEAAALSGLLVDATPGRRTRL